MSHLTAAKLLVFELWNLKGIVQNLNLNTFYLITDNSFTGTVCLMLKFLN